MSTRIDYKRFLRNGGTLSATNVTFNNSQSGQLQLQKGASANLSQNQFLNNNMLYVDASLASRLSGNTFASNSKVNILFGSLDTSATWPLITTVTYSLDSVF